MTNPISNIRATPRGRGAKIKIDAARGGIEVAVGGVSTADITAHGTPSAEQLFASVLPLGPVAPVLGLSTKDAYSIFIAIGGQQRLTALTIFIAPSGSPYPEVGISLSPLASGHAFDTLTPESSYTIIAFAENENGFAYSNELTIETDALPVPAVVAPTISSGGVGQSSLFTLITGAENVVSLIPRIRVTGESEWEERTAIAGSATGYNYTGLAPGAYDRQMIAVNEAGSAETNIISNVSTAEVEGFLLAEGHYKPAKFEMVLAHPRPDTETNPDEAHRRCIAGKPWIIPITASGGSPPFQYTLDEVSSTKGMYVGERYGDDNYGNLVWTNPVIGNHTITIVIRSQEYGRNTSGYTDEIIITWTLEVVDADDTQKVIHLSPSGDDDNPGTSTEPKRTLLSVLGSTNYSGRQIHLAPGTYTTDGPSELLIARSNRPRTLIGAGSANTFISYTERRLSFGNGLFVYGVTLQDGGYTANNVQLFYGSSDSNVGRITFFDVKSVDPQRGTVGSDNPTSVMFSALGGTTVRRYITFKDCAETGRAGGSGTPTILTVFYTCKNVVVENCILDGNSLQPGGYVKVGNQEISFRYTRTRNTSTNATGGSFGMNPAPQEVTPTKNIEWCYNFVERTVIMNRGNESTGSGKGPFFYYRNSHKDGTFRVRVPEAPWDIHIEACAFESVNFVNGQGQALNVGAGQDGNVYFTEMEVRAASGVFDGEFKLTDNYAEWRGKRGAEIENESD